MIEVTNKELKEIIKAVLFVSGDGIELFEFAEKFGRNLEEIKKLVKEMQAEFSGENGLHLITYSNKAQLSSNPKLSDHVASVLNPIREKALTKAAMQTLGIIAYKQPITRLEIESIRGVSADYAVQVLLENNMIEVVGRKDVVGKPLLFGTTEEFLKRFDLESVESLPNYEELLEKIQLIKEENTQKISSSLYREHTIQDEEIPGFLQGEKSVKRLTSEELEQKHAEEQALKQKFKDIDNVLKGARREMEEPKQEEENEQESISDDELNKLLEQALTTENKLDDNQSNAI